MDRADPNLIASTSFDDEGDSAAFAAEVVDQSSARNDAAVTIAKLGVNAQCYVAPLMLNHVGQWLEWPAWFTKGTSLESSDSLPDRITVADDLILTANLVDHGYASSMLKKIGDNIRFASGPASLAGLTNAPTLADALDLYCRSLKASNPHLDPHISIENGTFLFTLDSLLPPGRLLDFLSIAASIVACRCIESFVPQSGQELNLNLPLRPSAELENVLIRTPGALKFGSTAYSLSGNAAWLQKENPDHDTAFWLLALERIAAAERQGDGTAIVDRIRKSVNQALADEKRVPRLKQIAAIEGVSERTVVRMLAAKNTNFHNIVEEERRRKAAELIGIRTLCLSEIAETLGFTDMSSFGRSFRQWFGNTPGQYRKSL
jgi:AraC-like DNA-binding protein